MAETDFGAGDFFAAGLAAGFLATAFTAGLAAAFLAGAFAAVFGLAAGFLAAAAFFAGAFVAGLAATFFTGAFAAVFGLAAGFLVAATFAATFAVVFAAGLAAAFLAGAFALALAAVFGLAAAFLAGEGFADFFGATFAVTFDILTSSLSLILSFGFGICNLLCTVARAFIWFTRIYPVMSTLGARAMVFFCSIGIPGVLVMLTILLFILAVAGSPLIKTVASPDVPSVFPPLASAV